jgi:hypothetical protein
MVEHHHRMCALTLIIRRHLNHIFFERLRAWILHLPDAADDDTNFLDLSDTATRARDASVSLDVFSPVTRVLVDVVGDLPLLIRKFHREMTDATIIEI